MNGLPIIATKNGAPVEINQVCFLPLLLILLFLWKICYIIAMHQYIGFLVDANAGPEQWSPC